MGLGLGEKKKYKEGKRRNIGRWSAKRQGVRAVAGACEENDVTLRDVGGRVA